MTTDKNPTSFRLSDQALDNLDKITQATGSSRTAVIEIALAMLARKLEHKSHLQEKIMNNRTINKNSARKVAHQLFTGRSGKVEFYADPVNGELEALLAGEFPSEDFEYICTQNEGQIEFGQELCETDDEIEDLFDQWWNEAGAEWISDLEKSWAESQDL